jgi:hypothetical protein
LDSKDPLDHEDFCDISAILQHFVDRIPYTAMHGTTLHLHEQHELPPLPSLPAATAAAGAPLLQLDTLDHTGYAPRLLRWLTRSQLLQTSPPSKQPHPMVAKAPPMTEVEIPKQNMGTKSTTTTTTTTSVSNVFDDTAGTDMYAVDCISMFTKCGPSAEDSKGSQVVGSTKGRFRWVEILFLIRAIVGVHFHQLVPTGMNMVDLMRLTSPVYEHNKLAEYLHKEWKRLNIAFGDDNNHTFGLFYDAEHYRTRPRQQELWNAVSLKAHVSSTMMKRRIQFVLSHLVGNDSNRNTLTQWLKDVLPLILLNEQITQSEKLALSQFVGIFRIALENIRKTKLTNYCAAVVTDITVSNRNNTNNMIKLVYAPNTNSHDYQFLKSETDINQHKKLVYRLAKVHHWRYKLKEIERSAERHALIDQDLNLTSFETKFNTLKLLLTTNGEKDEKSISIGMDAEKKSITIPIPISVPISNQLGTTQSKLLTEEEYMQQEQFLKQPILHSLLHQSKDHPHPPTVNNINVNDLIPS